MRFRSSSLVILTFGLLAGGFAQEAPMPQLSPGSARKPAQASIMLAPAQSVVLTVPKGTPLKVALDQEVCVKKVGQTIHGRIVEPIYAFDQAVIPVGSELNGRITKIERTTGGKRTLAALDGDFTPERKIEVSFSELLLADGRRLPVETTVGFGSGQVIQFVSAAEARKKRA